MNQPRLKGDWINLRDRFYLQLRGQYGQSGLSPRLLASTTGTLNQVR